MAKYEFFGYTVLAVLVSCYSLLYSMASGDLHVAYENGLLFAVVGALAMRLTWPVAGPAQRNLYRVLGGLLVARTIFVVAIW